jgi:hypothetical protein
MERRYVMKNWTVDDVMTTKVVSVDQEASYRSVVDKVGFALDDSAGYTPGIAFGAV